MEKNRQLESVISMKKIEASQGHVIIGSTFGNNTNLSHNNINNMKRNKKTNIEKQTNNTVKGSGSQYNINSVGDGANFGSNITQNQTINKNNDSENLENKIRAKRLERENLESKLIKEFDDDSDVEDSLVKILDNVQKHVKGELEGDWDKSGDLRKKIRELKKLAKTKLGKKISSDKIREVCWAQAEEENLKKQSKNITERRENEVEELEIGEIQAQKEIPLKSN